MNRFLSFADSRMSAALERLGRQAEALDFFDEITLFTEHDLSAEFTSRMGRYLTPSCRGFGYWSWKPWSIHHVLQEMEEGDRLLYLDAGCHINANGTDRFREYVNMLDRDSRGMLVFTNGQPEYKWTKGDIFRHFGVSQEDGHITHTQQIAGGHVFLKKNPLTESLIRDWLHVFYDHLHLADNTPSASPNLPGFVENRYDQSIFSILCKLRGITTLDGSETYAENWKQLSLFPFQDRRDMGIPRAGKKGWLEKCRQLLLSSKRNGFGIRYDRFIRALMNHGRNDGFAPRHSPVAIVTTPSESFSPYPDSRSTHEAAHHSPYMQKPFFSIIIPAYNLENYIAAALQSVLVQTFQNFEIIIVDDGSSDETVSIIQSFHDPRIRLVSQVNGGVSRARNAGMKKAVGAYIAFMDGDDYWYPEHLELAADFSTVIRRYWPMPTAT